MASILTLITIIILSQIAPLDAGIYNGISFTHEFEGITIQTSYRSDYGESAWQITDNKELYIALEIIEQPENTTIMIEHMHADISIHSYKEEVDGLTQDSMDDKMHTGNQEGFFVNMDYPYYETFAVEGYSKFLIEGWGFLIAYYGWGSIKEKRLTEANLRKVGAQGSEVVTIFDVLIKHDNEDAFHKRIIADDFYIFFDGGFEPSGTREERKEIQRIYNVTPAGYIAFIVAVLLMIGGIVIGLKVDGLLGWALIIIGMVIVALALIFGGISATEIVVERPL